MSKIRNLTLMAFIASLLILFLLSFVFFKRTNTLDQYIDSIAHSSEILLQLEKINGFWMESSRSIRNYLLIEKTELLDPYYESKIELQQQLDTISLLAKGNSRQEKVIEKIKSISKKRLQTIDRFILLHDLREDKKIEFLTIIEGFANQFRNSYVLLRENEERVLKYRQDVKNKFENVTPFFLLASFIITISIFIISFWLLFQNMIKRIQVEKELQQKLIILDQANIDLENLTVITSHHIQEPTRKIRNFSTMMQSMLKSSISDNATDLLQRIEQNASHLQNLFINLVKYSNIIRQSDKMELIDLNSILQKSKNNLEEIIIRSNTLIHSTPLPSITGVRNHIQILFDELLRNAIQFSDEKRTPVINIRSNQNDKDKTIKIFIEDNGIGFPNEYATRIFKLFEQLQPYHSEGKGIGLTMCSRIMANHGGSIEAYGNPGNGSCFTLLFNKFSSS